MSIEQQDQIIESSINLKEIAWVTQQIKEELKIFNKEGFYEKKGDKVFYNLNTVKQYLGVLKDKKTRKELVTKNSSAMIMAVQIALYSLDYSFGNVDGILGDKTKEAIRKFQSDNNLPVDASGRSLPSTIQKLVELIGEKGEIITEDGKTDGEINENLGNIEDNKMGDEKLEAINNQIDKETTKEDINNKENEETLDQEVIRPEVQELIDSLNINGDRFQGLTYLTKSEAIAIATKSRGYFITLTGIKEIDEDVFEELLKYKGGITIGLENLTAGLARKLVESGKGITFSGLESIDQEVYEELGKTRGTLRFKSLKSITEEGMGELVKKPGGEIYLNSVEEINEGAAEKMVSYPRNIYLDGVKHITKEVIEKFSKKNRGRISMKGLEAPLSEDVLDALMKVERQYLDLNHEVVSQLSKYKKQKEL